MQLCALFVHLIAIFCYSEVEFSVKRNVQRKTCEQLKPMVVKLLTRKKAEGSKMTENMENIVKAIDEEIAALKMDLSALELVRRTLFQQVESRPVRVADRIAEALVAPKPVRGRPKKAPETQPSAAPAGKGKRGLSEAGRKAISEAVKRRHAANKALKEKAARAKS